MVYDLKYWKKWRATTKPRGKAIGQKSKKRTKDSSSRKQTHIIENTFKKEYIKSLLESERIHQSKLQENQKHIRQEQKESPLHLNEKLKQERLVEQQLREAEITLVKSPSNEAIFRGGFIGAEKRWSSSNKSSSGSNPGPGEYKVCGGIGTQILSQSRSMPSSTFSKASDRGAIVNADSPGPVYSVVDQGGGYHYTFSKAARDSVTTENTHNRTPGPGAYCDPALPKGAEFTFGTSRKDLTYGPFTEETPSVLTSSGFGHGCNLEEHIKYGRCVDGLCSTRAAWEFKVPDKPEQKYGGNERPMLHIAFINSKPPYRKVEEILQQDSNQKLDERDDDNKTILHVVCEAGFPADTCYEKVKNALALSKKWKRPLDLDIQDSSGNTALLVATLKMQTKTVELLLQNGSNPELVNMNGETAISIAAQKNYHKIFQHLRSSIMNRDIQASIQDVKIKKRIIRSRQASRRGSFKDLAAINQERPATQARAKTAVSASKSSRSKSRNRTAYGSRQINSKRRTSSASDPVQNDVFGGLPSRNASRHKTENLTSSLLSAPSTSSNTSKESSSSTRETKINNTLNTPSTSSNSTPGFIQDSMSESTSSKQTNRSILSRTGRSPNRSPKIGHVSFRTEDDNFPTSTPAGGVFGGLPSRNASRNESSSILQTGLEKPQKITPVSSSSDTTNSLDGDTKPKVSASTSSASSTAETVASGSSLPIFGGLPSRVEDRHHLRPNPDNDIMKMEGENKNSQKENSELLKTGRESSRQGTRSDISTSSRETSATSSIVSSDSKNTSAASLDITSDTEANDMVSSPIDKSRIPVFGGIPSRLESRHNRLQTAAAIIKESEVEGTGNMFDVSKERQEASRETSTTSSTASSDSKNMSPDSPNITSDAESGDVASTPEDRKNVPVFGGVPSRLESRHNRIQPAATIIKESEVEGASKVLEVTENRQEASRETSTTYSSGSSDSKNMSPDSPNITSDAESSDIVSTPEDKNIIPVFGGVPSRLESRHNRLQTSTPIIKESEVEGTSKVLEVTENRQESSRETSTTYSSGSSDSKNIIPDSSKISLDTESNDIVLDGQNVPSVPIFGGIPSRLESRHNRIQSAATDIKDLEVEGKYSKTTDKIKEPIPDLVQEHEAVMSVSMELSDPTEGKNESSDNTASAQQIPVFGGLPSRLEGRTHNAEVDKSSELHKPGEEIINHSEVITTEPDSQFQITLGPTPAPELESEDNDSKNVDAVVTGTYSVSFVDELLQLPVSPTNERRSSGNIPVFGGLPSRLESRHLNSRPEVSAGSIGEETLRGYSAYTRQESRAEQSREYTSFTEIPASASSSIVSDEDGIENFHVFGGLPSRLESRQHSQSYIRDTANLNSPGEVTPSTRQPSRLEGHRVFLGNERRSQTQGGVLANAGSSIINN